MSNKTRVMDPNRMEYVYAETMQYKRKVTNIAEEIKREIKVLSNPALLDGMRGGQGDAAIETIKNVARSAENLAARALTLSQFLDSRIEALAALKKDKSGFGDAGAKAAGATKNLRK